MTTFNDIALWVMDILKRPTTDVDILTTARSAALNFYRLLASKIPFDELQTTSGAMNMIPNQGTYSIGTELQFVPQLRAIQNIKLTYDVSNSVRLRRSHVRVYDAISATSSGRPATYARWDTTIIVNPNPQAAFTWQYRYWFRPTIGLLYNIVGATYAGGTITLTLKALGSQIPALAPGDIVDVIGVNPSDFNLNKVALAGASIVVDANGNFTVTIANSLASTPVYVIGGQLLCQAPTTTNWYDQQLLTPIEWDELIRWETLFRVYYSLDQPEKAATLVSQRFMQEQRTGAKKQHMYEPGIIPRLWNDLLETVSQKENVDEDFSINPVIRAYSTR